MLYSYLGIHLNSSWPVLGMLFDIAVCSPRLALYAFTKDFSHQPLDLLGDLDF